MKFYTGSVTGFAAGDKHRIIILAKNLHALISLSAWYDHKWINVYESKTNDITCKSHDMNSNFEEIFQVNRIIIINHSLFIRRYLAKYWNYCPSKVLLCSNVLNYNHNPIDVCQGKLIGEAKQCHCVCRKYGVSI